MAMQSSDLTESIQSAAKSGDTVTIPPGVHEVCIDIPEGSRGLKLVGAGRNRTFIRSNVKGQPALRARGLWYSQISGIAFETQLANEAVVDIDGTPGVLGVQGNTFSDCIFNAQGTHDGQRSRYAFALNRTSGSHGQGSEQCFINCHFQGAYEACYYQYGYNALNNQFIGGNFQNYTKHGILSTFGSFHLYGVGFQSTTGIEQVKNDGWDISAFHGGAGDALTISGCRTESLRFIKTCASQPPMISCCNQRAPEVIEGHNVVECETAVILNCNWQCGQVLVLRDLVNFTVEVNSDYVIPPGVRTVLADASKGNIRLTLSDESKLPSGHSVEVIRADKVAKYSVQVLGTHMNNDYGRMVEKLNHTTRRSGRFLVLGGGVVPRRWYVVRGH